MMTDPLMWSPISLGRWFGCQVRVHIFLVIFVVLELLNAAIASPPQFTQTAAWIALLLLALAVHELGHALAASILGSDAEDVRLWPLGNMVGPQVMMRSPESPLVIAAGPLANALVVIVTAIGLSLSNAQFVWYPFGNTPDAGAPMLAEHQLAQPFHALWWSGWFGYLNYVLMLANLLPALPFDGGRMVRSLSSSASFPGAKDGMVAPWTAHAVAGLLALTGLVRLLSGFNGSVTLIGLAILIELIVRSESRIVDDDGFFGDGVFGYDFSEGYTSLEGSAAKVRPYRESAIKRWRRRRSDLRRQRRQAREAAEERRMDEILEKLYREGRHALSDEEHRFLVRVSAKYRNRPKASD
jgi:Zn-dependent protease